MIGWGEWAQSGLLKPVAPSDSFREAFYDFTWDAALWNGETYGYPISVESLGLIYNKALVETPPRKLCRTDGAGCHAVPRGQESHSV